MVIERLMWGSDWNDPRLTALLRDRRPPSVCAACNRPVDSDHAGSEGRLLCTRCDTAEQD